MKSFYAYCEYFLGRVYLRILQQAHRNLLTMLGKDVRYLFGNVLAAAAEMDAPGLRGPALLDLARLYALQGSRS
jgi:hypothetical protein